MTNRTKVKCKGRTFNGDSEIYDGTRMDGSENKSRLHGVRFGVELDELEFKVAYK